MLDIIEITWLKAVVVVFDGSLLDSVLLSIISHRFRLCVNRRPQSIERILMKLPIIRRLKAFGICKGRPSLTNLSRLAQTIPLLVEPTQENIAIRNWLVVSNGDCVAL